MVLGSYIENDCNQTLSIPFPYVIKLFVAKPGRAKYAKAKDAKPLEAYIAALSSITPPLFMPPYIFITAGNGPSPGGKNNVPRKPLFSTCKISI